MTSRWKRREHQPAHPLSNRTIALGAVVVLGIGAAAFIVLWWRYGGADPDVELNVIRTAGALMAGAGGAVALVLAARRQRSNELTLEHQRKVAAATERNAAEQRITELYTQAVDQLGAEKAPVRLGGLHALERLGQNNPAQRQTIVDVICAYLRMPYTPPRDQALGDDASEDTDRHYEQSRHELQVRLTAQRILAAHLAPEAAEGFWADIDLDLTGAHLHQLDLTGCRARTARFSHVRFAGGAMFHGITITGGALFFLAEFAGVAGFNDAQFTGDVDFSHARLNIDAVFRGACFAGFAGFGGATFGGAEFNGAIFAEHARFTGAKFHKYADFSGATFTGDAIFHNSVFDWGTTFSGATFGQRVVFYGTKFGQDAILTEDGFLAENEEFGGVDFSEAKFTGDTDFGRARVTESSAQVVLPTGWSTRAAPPAKETNGSWLDVVRDECLREHPVEPFVDPQLPENDPF